MQTQTATTEYNGHKSKGHWNVSLWIGNDEHLYRFAMECIKNAKRDVNPGNSWLRLAAARFCDYNPGRTPDGFKYTRERVRAALSDLDS